MKMTWCPIYGPVRSDAAWSNQIQLRYIRRLYTRVLAKYVKQMCVYCSKMHYPNGELLSISYHFTHQTFYPTQFLSINIRVLPRAFKRNGAYSFHSEHYAWVLCTTSSTKPSATPSILNYRYYHRYYNPIVMREGGISGKVECVRMVTNRDIRFFFQSVGVHERLRKCTVLNRWTTILRNVLRG